MSVIGPIRGAVAFAGVCALLLAGCASTGSAPEKTTGPPQDVTITFNWWGNDSRAEKYEQSIDLFEKKYPYVTVKTGFASWGDYWSARNTEAAGRALPDVFQMDIGYITEFGHNGLLRKLDDQVGDTIDISGLPEALLPSGQIDGTTYAIASSINTFASVYNPALLKKLGVEAPTADMTWADYNDFLLEVSEAGASSDPKTYGSVDYTNTFWAFAVWLGQRDQKLFTDDGELDFTQDDLEEWWGLHDELRDAKAVYPAARATQIAPQDAIAIGETASQISWDNFLVRFSEGAKDAEFAMVAPPTDNPDDRGLFLKPSLQLVEGANTEHPKEAGLLIDFLVNDSAVGKIFGVSRGVPASSKALKGVTLTGLDAAVVDYEKSIAEDLKEAPAPPVAGFGTLEANFLTSVEDIDYGKATVEEAAKAWFDESKIVLGE